MKIRLAAAAVFLFVFVGVGQLIGQSSLKREDCIPYDPSTLLLTDRGAQGWLISRDDGARFIGLDTKEDAELMLSIFKAHDQFCYVGRDNKRADRDHYVHHYWK
jgi:hypothetical protein